MKPCLTCNTKPIKNGIYKANIQNFVLEKLPQNNKSFHNKINQKFKLSGLEPNKTIFYFGTDENDFTKKIKDQLNAYNKLKNSGVVKVDKNGDATLYLNCPQLYMDLDGNVYGRHLHFIYYNDKKMKWDLDLFTHKVLCNVNKDFVEKHIKKVVIIDSRSTEEYEKDHLKNAISFPYNKKISEEIVMEKIQSVKKNYSHKLCPIIIYCNSYDNGFKLYEKLNKLGFYNTVHYTWDSK